VSRRDNFLDGSRHGGTRAFWNSRSIHFQFRYSCGPGHSWFRHFPMDAGKWRIADLFPGFLLQHTPTFRPSFRPSLRPRLPRKFFRGFSHSLYDINYQADNYQRSDYSVSEHRSLLSFDQRLSRECGGKGSFQAVKLQRPARTTVCSHSTRDMAAVYSIESDLDHKSA
jgi:hypothetical protein